jgi:hypothetical protein
LKGYDALRLLRRGATIARCDWGFGYESGVNSRLPHIPGARDLCALACLRARISFEEGRSAEALDDAVAAMALARHVSRGGASDVLLMGSNLEHPVIETLARYLPALRPDQMEELQRRLVGLPEGGTPATAIQSEEKQILDWFVGEVKKAPDQERLVSLLAFVCQISELGGKDRSWNEQGRAFLRTCGGTADGVLRRAEQMRPCYALLARKLELSPGQFAKEWKVEAAKRSANPLFPVLFATVERTRWQQARIDVRRAMLRAAVDVQRQGRDALKRHQDPIAQGSFEYVAMQGGFELRSQRKWPASKGVSLRVGGRETANSSSHADAFSTRR